MIDSEALIRRRGEIGWRVGRMAGYAPILSEWPMTCLPSTPLPARIGENTAAH
jgi:hypothetical protein